MHSRRALMTLKRQLPSGIRYYAHTYAPENVTRENWYLKSALDGANVLKNWEAIPRYLEWETSKKSCVKAITSSDGFCSLMLVGSFEGVEIVAPSLVLILPANRHIHFREEPPILCRAKRS